MTGPVTGQMSAMQDQLQQQSVEIITLKWIIAQLMQRYGKDYVLLHMDNPAKFDIAVIPSPEKRLVDVRIKRVVEVVDAPDAASGPHTN